METGGGGHGTPLDDLNLKGRLSRMSIAQIEAELKNLSPEELRRLALSSWAVFLEKAGSDSAGHECDENDPALLAALDAAVDRANRSGDRGLTGDEVRARIRQWTTR